MTRKQKETRRGRAELRLADRAALWNVKPENRHLPSWWEYLNIRLLTKQKTWTKPQRTMMTKAGRVHGLRWSVAVCVLITTVVAVQQYLSKQEAFVAAERLANDGRHAESLVEAVLTAPADAVPYAIQNLRELREHAIPLLQNYVLDQTANPSLRLHAVFALATFGQVESEFLVSNIREASSGEVPNIVSALRGSKEAAVQSLRREADLADGKKGLAIQGPRRHRGPASG